MNDSSPGLLDDDLYKGLKVLSDLSFPKICGTCGKRYETLEDFIRQTEMIQKSSGLKEDLDDDGCVIVGLFRNCTCGSTLMHEFNDRRNLTKSGIERRKKFGELLNKLTQKGIAHETARAELLKVMQGKGSEILRVKPDN